MGSYFGILILLLIVFLKSCFGVQCEFCKNEYRHIGKHLWRCKERLNRDDSTININLSNVDLNTHGTSSIENIDNPIYIEDPLLNGNQEIELSNYDHDPNEKKKELPFKCYCGRYFETLRGLNVHRRSCFITEQANYKDLFTPQEFIPDITPCEIPINHDHLPKFNLLPGVKLPKTDDDWKIANDYFKVNLNYSSEINDIETTIKEFNGIVYSYFYNCCGPVNRLDKDLELKKKYNNLSKNKLKKILKSLKIERIKNLAEIKYVSHLLRSKLKKEEQPDSFNHNVRIKENYWKYCKKYFESKETVLPEFSETDCYNHFMKTCHESKPSKVFNLPSWMETLNDPTKDFNIEPPRYSEINKIIKKMKSSGSSCPLDQISVLMLKKCPILRTVVWKICCYCWMENLFPSDWKNSTTILIFKKGDPKDPSNFRPITLEPILSKVMTSLIRNRIFTYVVENDYIETNIQKGFWSNISGSIEHTELLSCILKEAKTKQRQLVVTLFDLKNAFGEVHHNLIKSVLKYHNIPTSVIDLINSLYSDYSISITTKDFVTNPIKVKRGVLQGDCLSPLIFNLCMNTLIKSIKSEKISCLGYVLDKILTPRHWLQFADDTAIVTSLQEDNQLLCNVFSKWCSWADLIIRVDKCHTFGIKKSATASIQYSPNILVQREKIPPIELNDSFIYLGKQFNFGLNIDSIKSEITNDMLNYTGIIDKLPLDPHNKISIIQTYVFSKLRWRFSIYDLTETWVDSNIDNIINKYMRKWLQFPVCANITHLTFPNKKLGMNIKSAKTLFNQCQLSTRRILKQSKNPEIQSIYAATSSKHINHDSIINSVASESRNLAVTTNKQFNSRVDREHSTSVLKNTWNKFMNLNEQSILISHIVKVCPTKIINMWQVLAKRLPSNIFSFCRKSLIMCLPNKSNLHRWRLADNNQCILCQNMQTQLHVLSNCSKCLNRYTWRHDSVINSILLQISKSVKSTMKIYCDCNSLPYSNTSEIFANQRPDIAIVDGSKIVVIELTVCFEKNTSKSREYKVNRYGNLKSQLLIPSSKIEIIFLEITTLGFISKQSYQQFAKYLKSIDVHNSDHLIYKCMETVIRSSYYIFCRRNKCWTYPELLTYT